MNLKYYKKFLDVESKRQFLLATLFMIIASIIEAFGIGLIIPLIKIIGDGGSQVVMQPLGIFNKLTSDSILVVGLLIVAAFALKSLLLTMNTYQYFIFSYNLQTKISKKLFENYLDQANILLDKNKMIANIYGECEKLTHQVIIPFTVLASEITIVLFLLGLLLWSSPHITIYAFVIFSIVYIIFNETTKRYIKKISYDRQFADYKKISEIDKSLSQIIEIKLYNTVRSRVISYENFAYISGNSNAMNGVLGGLPRIFMETLVVFIIISYCVYKIGLKNISIMDVVPEITMFSIIGYRLLPSLNRISNAKSNLQYSNIILSNLYNELYSPKFKNGGKITNLVQAKNQPVLKLRHLKSKYGYAGYINYDINVGDVVCINGSSGAGKTTFLYTIMGFLVPENGVIDFNETNIHENLDWYRSNISYLPQNVVIRDASLYENITFEHDLTSIPINKKYEEVSLISNIDWIDNLYSESSIGSVSAGQAQRIGIARALYHKKKILILDEPTSALDKQNATVIMQEIIKRSKDCILIMVTHDEELKKLCNRFLDLK